MIRWIDRSFIAVALCILIATFSRGDEKYIFYKGYPYGSQANYNPLGIMMNGSYDILQIDNQNNHIFKIHYREGSRNVWDNITHPLERIQQFGWHRFVSTELIPQQLEPKQAQYWPNYKLHLLGGGMTYYATAEWYRYHGFTNSKTMSVVTMAAYHYLNEVVENNTYRGATVDPIADLLIFDPLGIVLFSFDGVPQFFGETLQMADWSFQPIINLNEGTLINNGQNYSYKIPIPFFDRWKLFYLSGMEGVVGLTRQYTESDNITVGGGFSAKDLIAVENNTGVRTQTATLVWTGGIFYDRNNSLLASLIVKGQGGPRVRLNIYPGIFDTGALALGFAGILDKFNDVSVGLFVRYVPVGLGMNL
jgi:hypothetical protein